MKKLLILTIIGGLVFNASFAQTKKLFKYSFVNQTEFGVLFGRVKNTNYYYPSYSSYWPGPTTNGFNIQNIASVSLQTFNGFKVRKMTTVGFTTGLDLYSSTLLVPVAFGVRHVFYEKSQEGAKLQAGLDAGFGSTVANASNSYETVKGGALVNPTIGFKFPTKNGSSWLINLGYKYQYLEITQNFEETDIYNISSKETRNLKRFQVRLGFEF